MASNLCRSPPLFTFKPHETVVNPRNGIPEVRPVADYVMLSNGGERVYVQRGEVYAGDLDTPCHPDRYPAWFWDSYKHLSSDARKACGLKLPEDNISSLDQLPAEFLETFKSLPPHLQAQLVPPSQDAHFTPTHDTKDETSPQHLWNPSPDPMKPSVAHWECPECTEVMTMRQKGIHIARHRRAQKRATMPKESTKWQTPQ